jgi:hypothetical protein
MLDWVHAHQAVVWWLIAISALTFVTSIIAVPWMLVRIPARYFMTTQHEHPWADRHPLIRHSFVIGKNLLGIIFVVLGLLMLILPGQGILTILAGLVLVDFPGKHRVLLWTMSRPAVLKSVNWIRGKANHEPLVMPGVN